VENGTSAFWEGFRSSGTHKAGQSQQERFV